MVTLVELPHALEGDVLADLAARIRAGALTLAEDSPIRADLLGAAERYELLATIRGVEVR